MGSLTVVSSLLTLLAALPQGSGTAGSTPAPGNAPHGTTVEDLAELARKRGLQVQESIRARFDKLLPDLALPWETQKEYLRDTFQAVQALGPEVAPLLLEQFRREARDPGDEERLRNCARLLQDLGAGPYVDELLRIVDSGRPEARIAASRLLAGVGERRLVPLLRKQLKDAGNHSASEFAEALRELRAREALPEVIELIGRKDVKVRRAGLRALAEIGGLEQLQLVLDAFKIEKDSQPLAEYLRFLSRHAHAHAAAAEALVPYVGQDGVPDLVAEDLLRALGTVAPEGHKPAMDALRNQLKSLQTSMVRAAAYSLLQLGDPAGTKIVLNEYTRLIGQNKNQPRLYIMRGDALLLYGKHADALKDYKRAVDLSPKNQVDATVQVAIARCQAKARQWPEVQRALKATGYGAKELRELVERHVELKEAVEQSPLVKKLLEG